MAIYLKEFESHSDYTTYINSEDKILPNVSICNDLKDVHYNSVHNYSRDYLTTEALSNGTISFNIKSSINTDRITSISYSTDNGETWTTTANQDDKEDNLVITVNVNTNDKILWKGDAVTLGKSNSDTAHSFFSSTCNFDVKGNVMSLLYGDNFKGQITLNNVQPFYTSFAYLFSDPDANLPCNVINAKDLSLPAITLVPQCYSNMFCGCTNLITAPVLPATTLAEQCYISMFGSCTSLTKAPELPATTLANGCYSGMFQGCTNPVNAPVLPATTLATECYDGMFWGCTNLTTAPELPATTLANWCYGSMFYNCTSLTTAPELPAVNLAGGSCYYQMFYGCTNLNYIKAMFTTISGPDLIGFTQDWVNGVAATGTFVKNSAATWNETGVNGVPSGWTVETASE